jgi:hypothetical protein
MTGASSMPFQTSDFAFFAATWWPKAGYKELRVLLFLAIWLFTWDDEVDEPSGAYSGSLSGAEQYRMQTTDLVLECLGLRIPSSAPAEPTNKIIASFRDIGDELAKLYSLGTLHDRCNQGQFGLTVHGRGDPLPGAYEARAANSSLRETPQCKGVLELSGRH